MRNTAKPLPSRQELLRVLSYCPESGTLTWKRREIGCTAGGVAPFDERTANSWNAMRTGKPAMQSVDHKGYLRGKVFGKLYLTHRIIWKMVTGFDPAIIDHINGDKSDNRIRNLRSCTNSENCRNYAKGFGSSEFRGVSWVKRDKKWAASISDGKGGKVSLGHHSTELAAAKAYDDAAARLHGDFATLNFPRIDAAAMEEGKDA